MYVFQPAKRTAYKRLITVERVFSPFECEALVAMFQEKIAVEATVKSDGEISHTARKSTLTWLHWNEDLRWVFDRLEKATNLVNNKFYGFQLSGFYEALQLTRYNHGDFYNWHEDGCEAGLSTRKLSLSLQLTDPELYKGGKLIIFPDEEAGQSLGSCTFFPSYLTHRVTPMTSGTRHSLVAWVTGEPFR